MDKKLVLAVAGSGKTYYLCQTLVEKEKNLLSCKLKLNT